MPANTDPIFTRVGHIDSITVTAANTKSDGAGTIATDIFKAFTADATNGSFLQRVRWIPTGTTANTNTTATVARIFVSSITSGATTAANTFLIAEVTLPVIQADSSTLGAAYFDIVLGIPLNPGWTVLVTNHAAPAANTAWRAVVIGGDY